jgi:hypothetical protein
MMFFDLLVFYLYLISLLFYAFRLEYINADLFFQQIENLNDNLTRFYLDHIFYINHQYK